jgi:hypothetical protein
MFNPIKVTDVTLRDGLEDFVLRRLRLDDLGRLVGLLDRTGFYSLDCWGGPFFPQPAEPSPGRPGTLDPLPGGLETFQFRTYNMNTIKNR